MPTDLEIEIVSDVVCPWCYIGKRRLEKALSLVGDGISPTLTWRPFQLNPDMPEGGMPRAEYRKRKFGSVERGAQLDARVAAEGKGEGIAFAFERIERTPNTSAAHRLIELAQREGKGQGVVDALFRAYFEEGRDIGDAAVLESISRSNDVQGWPAKADAPGVARLEETMRGFGISAVPTFIFARKFGVSGAHPPESLAQAIQESLK